MIHVTLPIFTPHAKFIPCNFLQGKAHPQQPHKRRTMCENHVHVKLRKHKQKAERKNKQTRLKLNEMMTRECPDPATSPGR